VRAARTPIHCTRSTRNQATHNAPRSQRDENCRRQHIGYRRHAAAAAFDSRTRRPSKRSISSSTRRPRSVPVVSSRNPRTMSANSNSRPPSAEHFAGERDRRSPDSTPFETSDVDEPNLGPHRSTNDVDEAKLRALSAPKTATNAARNPTPGMSLARPTRYRRIQHRCVLECTDECDRPSCSVLGT
jgi:hypothetical protein